MQNLKLLSKAGLLANIQGLVTDERRLTLSILHHLREIERRRLFAELGYSSLFEYCVKDLKYSESSASRRVAAMRLLKELPEFEPAIESGKLNLSAVGQAQSLFRQQSHTIEEKRELIKSLEGKSKRECEKIVATRMPELPPVEKERPINQTQTELKLVVSDELLEDLKKLQALHGKASYADLLEWMAKVCLKKTPEAPETKETKETEKTAQSLPPVQVNSRVVPVGLKREIYKRDQGRCSYVSPLTKRACGSRKHLQLDHRLPFARGGETSAENLRLLCPVHNQLKAIESFGSAKMAAFIPGLK